MVNFGVMGQNDYGQLSFQCIDLIKVFNEIKTMDSLTL